MPNQVSITWGHLTGSFDWNPRDLVLSMGYGAASGSVTGALTGAISYHISDEYACGVDKKVLEYGNGLGEVSGDRDVILKMGRYVQNAESVDLDVAFLETENGYGTAAIPASNGTDAPGINWSTGLDEKGKFSASRFYSSIVHENDHIQDKIGRFSELYSEASNLAYKFKSADYQTHYNSIREIGAIRYELNHRYFQFWSPETQEYARDRLMRSYFGLQSGY